MRVALAGALTTAGGPAVGSGSPVIEANDLMAAMSIGGPAKDQPLRLLMFVSAMCPLCKGLIPVAKSFADERLDLAFMGDDDVAVQRKLIAQQGLEGYTFVNGPDVGRLSPWASCPMRC
jgi:hypothetical protein